MPTVYDPNIRAAIDARKRAQQPTVYQQPTQVRPPGYAWETPGGNVVGHGAVVEDTPSWVAPQLRPTETYSLDPSVATPTTENPPKTNEPPASGGGGGGGTSPVDWHNDPFLTDIMGQRDTDLRKRNERALERKRKILLGFGSKELARQILGADDPYLNEISDSPDSPSWLGQKKYLWGNQRRDFNEASNEANLWYGGGRFLGLGQMDRANLLEQSDYVTQNLNPQFQSIDDDIQAAMAGWTSAINTAGLAAYTRSLPTAAAA